MREEVRFPGHGGDEVRAALFRPDDNSELRPAVVLAHEVFGLDAFMDTVGERFARAGYFALAPDLYSREGVPGPGSTAREPAPAWTGAQIRAAVAGLPDRRAVADLDAAAGFLAARDDVDADRIAACGFCMGGNYAFLLGCQSRRIGAVVDFYGRIVYAELSREKPNQPLELALNLSAPLLGLFGEEDASIPMEDVRKLEAVMGQFAKPAEIETFPGAGHGFANPLREGWREEQAEAAWALALDFLNRSLEPAG